MSTNPLPAPIPRRIFFSYSQLDHEFATRLADSLKHELGDTATIWQDVGGGLAGGDTWWPKIIEAIAASDIFIVLLSPAAMRSKWVKDEITLAWQRKNSSTPLRIIPVLYQECDIRDDLRSLHFISFLEPHPYEQALADLVHAIRQPLLGTLASSRLSPSRMLRSPRLLIPLLVLLIFIVVVTQLLHHASSTTASNAMPVIAATQLTQTAILAPTTTALADATATLGAAPSTPPSLSPTAPPAPIIAPSPTGVSPHIQTLFDFEDGTTQNWGNPSDEITALKNSTDYAQTGTHSLEIKFIHLISTAQTHAQAPVNQTVTAGAQLILYVYTPTNLPLRAEPFVTQNATMISSNSYQPLLANTWNRLAFPMPASLTGQTISQVGLRFQSAAGSESGSLWIDDVQWQST